MSANPFFMLRSLAEQFCEVPGGRPVTPGVVTDTSEYVYPGNAYVTVSANDRSIRAIYRDGPVPAVGDRLQILRLGPDTGSPWLALPLPQPQGCGMLYTSAYSLADGSWAIVRCDTAIGDAWERRGAHPLGAADYPRRPLQRTLRYYNTSLTDALHSFAVPQRLHTWGSDLAYGTPGPHYYSDDLGATWTASGVSIVNLTSRPSYRGWLYAVSPETVYGSGDGGATWVDLATAEDGNSLPGGPYRAVYVSGAAFDGNIALATDGGVYTGTVFDDVIAPFFGGWASALENPPTPGSSIAIVGGEEFDGDWSWVATAHHSGPWTGVFTAGAGEDFVWVIGLAHTYDPATQHPGGLTGIPVAGHAAILATPASGDFVGDGAACYVVGLADATTGAGHTRFIRQALGEAWRACDARQVADLGAAYVPSPDGVSW